MDNKLILVNEEDEEIGYCKKMNAHINEYLHRAFSLFIYNKTDNKLLIHKRALGKYHSGGLWTNSCCSHPRYGENLIDSVIRRTKEELGLDINSYIDNLREVGKFHYYKKFTDCAENEIDHVFMLTIYKQPNILRRLQPKNKNNKHIFNRLSALISVTKGGEYP